MGTREWDLIEYFQMFFPSTYNVTVIETGGEPRQVSLHVINPSNQVAASHSGLLPDFLNICSMADIAASLREQLKCHRVVGVA